MQNQTRNPEDNERKNEASGSPGIEKEHEHHPEDTNRNSKEAQNKLYNWIKAHWDQLKELPTHEKLNLFFTLVIAVSTTAYVIVSKKQLTEMKNASILQRRIARLAYGEAIVNQSQLFVYRDEQGKQMRAELKFQNAGKADATFIKVAPQMAFRDSDPEPSEYSSEFKDAFPNLLSTFDEKKGNRALSVIENMPIPSDYKARKLYVWGKFRYEDSMGAKDSELFCLWGPDPTSPDIFARLGYGGNWVNCRTPANK